MFEETLIKGGQEALALLGQSKFLKDAYMAGGTAAALQLGHRISVDFYFFTNKKFIPRSFSFKLAKLGSFSQEQVSKGTLLGKFMGVKFSLFDYKYPLLFPVKNYCSLNLADIRDIAAMKVDAIASRGARRDFIDLYFICKAGHSLQDIFYFYNKKYHVLESNYIHLQKSLVFFQDAELEEMPRMINSVIWEDVKRYFEKELKKIAKMRIS